MNTKRQLISFLFYTLFMFFADFFISPEHTVKQHIGFAILCGIIFGTLMFFFYKFSKWKNVPK